MPNTGEPIPGTSGYPWTNGSANGGPSGTKRVTSSDKIRVQDINQLRDLMDLLIDHHHDYTDNKGC